MKNGHPKSAEVIVSSFKRVVFPVRAPPVSMTFFFSCYVVADSLKMLIFVKVSIEYIVPDWLGT